MADSVGGTVIWDLDVELGKLQRGLNEAKSMVEDSSKDIEKTFKNVGTEVTNIGKDLTIGITAPILAATAVGVSFTKIGGQYSSVLDSFKSMTQGMGIDALKFQKSVADATGGQIDNLTILQSATKGLALIGRTAFNDFGGDFVKMAELSKKAARATGQDVNFLFESLVTGVARESKLILDNLGISLDVTKAKDEYAKSIGKTTAELTQSEQKHAVLNDALKQLETTYGNVKVSAGGFSGAWQELTTFLTNSRIEMGQNLEPTFARLTKNLIALGKDILPSITGALKGVLDGFNNLDLGTQQFIIVSIGLIAGLGPVLVVFGTFIKTIGTVITLFKGIPAVIGVAKTAFMGLQAVFAFLMANPVVLIITAIIAVIALLAYLVVKNWDTIKAVFQSGFNYIKGVGTSIKNAIIDIYNSVSNTWNNLVNFLRGLWGSIVNAITGPFNDAKRTIDRIANEIKDAYNKINPFYRNSPSLVDNVTNGVGVIMDQYDSLKNLSFPAIAHEVAFQPATVEGSGGGNTNSININVEKVDSMQDVEALARELGFRMSLTR